MALDDQEAEFPDEDPLTALLRDRDPNVRIGALELWAAQNPGESLDPLTYAMVDPDESVRARAEKLFEEELGRREWAP